MADAVQSWTYDRLQYLQHAIERKGGFLRDENVRPDYEKKERRRA